MRKIKNLTENDVIAHWLKGELDYDFKGEKLRENLVKNKIPLSLVENPDISNNEENNIRKNILRYRGYPDSFLFKGFPNDLEWALYEISNEDILKIKYINNDVFWNDLTNGTRLIKDTQINNPIDKRQQKINRISKFLNDGNKIPEIIIVTDDISSIILEGHHRGAALAIVSKNRNINIQIIIGKSNNLKEWDFY